jgi:hypothetical protein
MTTPLEVFEAIWAASVTTVPLLGSVNYPFDTRTAPDPWAAVIYQPSTREDVTLGATPWVEESGLFLIGLFTKSGKGPHVLDAQVDDVRNAFHGAASNGLVITQVDGPHNIDPEGNGEWWQLGFAARYTFQSVRLTPADPYRGWDGFIEMSS